MNEVQIIATGRYVPEKIIDNNDLSCVVDTNDEWIKSRTGICERRISVKENTSDIAAQAAINALKNCNIDVKDIDLIIVATATPDYFLPSTACVVQNKIGAINATCFDISAACSGFIYGINIASQFIKTGFKKNALVIGAETLSKILNWNDKSTCVLFGDGAGAAILSPSKEKGIVDIYTGSDGSGGHLLKCPAMPLEINNPKLKIKLNKEKQDENNTFLSMEGREIFKFAVNIMQKSIKELLRNTGYKLEDIKYIVPHQANLRIIEFIAKKFNIDKEKFYINLEKYGNTSAASIPIALDELNNKGMLHKGDKIMMIGFGGGLTWGGTIIKWTI